MRSWNGALDALGSIVAQGIGGSIDKKAAEAAYGTIKNLLN